MKMNNLLFLILLIPNFFGHCERPEKFTNQTANLKSAPCDEWQRSIARLSSQKKEFLLRNGAIIDSGQEGTVLIVSDKLVGDCELRGEISSYFSRVLFADDHDENNPNDREFAALHSKDIVYVLRQIWESLSGSKALVGDGDSFESKYALLADPALSEADVGPLISDILDAETIDNSLARILFLRPMPNVLKPAMLRLQARAEHDESSTGQVSIDWQILNLAILNKMGDPNALHKLRRLYEHSKASSASKMTIRNLISKIQHHHALEFSDVEELEN